MQSDGIEEQGERGAGGGKRSAPQAPSSSPRPVTRGESKTQNVGIDWLNCTFDAPEFSQAAFIAHLARILRRPVTGTPDRGLFGFQESVKLIAAHGSQKSVIGALAWGGDAQRGRWMFQLTGTGCQFVRDWLSMRAFLEALDARLTRVDLCLDFLEGEHSVDEAVTLYELGGFQLGGRKPSTSLAGDWIGGEAGRTFYVGKGVNGKVLRVYEKGKQLGDSTSEWCRYEVQLGNRDRVIPFDVLTDRDAFFAGTYPALATMVEDAARSIDTKQTGGEVSLSHLMYHLKRCYGKVVELLAGGIAPDSAQLVDEVRVFGLPRRLNLSSVEAGLSWAQVVARMKAKETA